MKDPRRILEEGSIDSDATFASKLVCPQCKKPAPPTGETLCKVCGSELAVITPTYGAPVTPVIENRTARVLFAWFAGVLIGFIFGGNIGGWLGLGLVSLFGLPKTTAIYTAVFFIVIIAGAVKNLVLSDRITSLNG